MDKERFQAELGKLQTKMDSLNKLFQDAMGELNEQISSLQSTVTLEDKPPISSISADPIELLVIHNAAPDTEPTNSAPSQQSHPQIDQKNLTLEPVAEARSGGKDFSARLEQYLAITTPEPAADEAELETIKPHYAEENSQQPSKAKPTVTAKNLPSQKAVANKPVARRRALQQPAQPAQPSWLGMLIGSVVSLIFGPVTNLLTKAMELYKHYRDQGKAPVFLMTTAGMVTLLFGFGYMLQYSFVYLLNPPIKLLLCAAAGGGLVYFGHYLSNSKNYLRDYASSLIATGFVIDFLVIYFASDVYHLIGITLALIFYLLNSAGAMFLATRHETRVVAAVTLVGGLFVPAFGEHVAVAPYAYCPYALLICVGSLYLGRAIRWKELSVLTFISYSTATQLYVNSSDLISPAWYAAYLSIAFFAISFDALWNGKQIKLELHKYDLINSVANLSFYVWASYSVLGETPLLQAMYGGMALLFIALTYSNKLNKEPAGIFALQAAVFLGAALAALLGGEIWSLFFSLEAVSLIAVGCFYQNGWIRKEGYAALVLAVVQLISILFGVMGQHELLLFAPAWWALITCTVAIFASYTLLEHNKEELTDFEFNFIYLLDQAVNLAVSISILTSAYLVEFYWLYIVAFIPMFIVLNRTRNNYSMFTETLALAHFLIVLLGIKYGIELSSSLRFGLQPWWAKILRAETLCSLWLVSQFYQRYMDGKGLSILVEYPKLIFYALLPVVLASSIWRHFPDYQATGFWLSAAFALLLLKRLSHEIFRIEIVGFIALAIFSLKSVLLNQLAFAEAAVNVMAGVALFIVLLKTGDAFNKHLSKASELALLFPVAYHYFSFALFLVVYHLSNSVPIAITAVGYLNLMYCYFKPPFTPIRHQLRQYHLVAQLAAWIIATGTLNINVNSTLALLIQYSLIIASFACFHFVTPSARLLHRGAGQLWMMHALTIVGTATCLQKITGNSLNAYLSIALIIQASVVLLLTLTHRSYKDAAKLSIVIFAIATVKIFLFDMKESTTLEKMIAMIGIGLVLLIASYAYQKLKLQFDERNQAKMQT